LIQTRPPKTSDEYLRDVVIAPHRIGYSRASLIGLERTVDAEVGPCRISGLAGADYLVGEAESRNGELFYVGTAPSNLGSDWHPWTDLDRTRNVRIHHVDNGDGHPHAEAVDLKEGTRNVTVEYVTDRNAGHVTRGDPPGAIGFKSHDSTVRWCDLADATVGAEFAPGVGVYGNDLYGCHLRRIESDAFAFASATTTPDEQGEICDNLVEGLDEPQLYGCPSGVPSSDCVGHDCGDSILSGSTPTDSSGLP
jgi:hypothetical protein